MEWNAQNPNPNPQRSDNFRPVQSRTFWKAHGAVTVIVTLVLIAALVLLSESVFIVGESDQAVVSRFGVIKRLILNDGNEFHTEYADALTGEITLSEDVKKTYGSGLHFKMPFVDKVETYSGRLFTYVSSSEVVNTAEKKQYYITTYAQWRIADPALFSLKLGSLNAAENQLDNIIHPVIVQAINRMLADDFISNKDKLNEALQDGLATINKDMCVRGIEVVDIQIHRTILPTANIESTYARMQADRAKVAQQLRSEGNEEYNKAVAAADLEARQIEAAAVSEAGAIRGAADAEAAEIYAQAYAADPEFYAYWRSLQALKEAIGEDATLVLDPTNPLFANLMQYITD
ncbi:MAG: protease modulator HflC [Clostridia bacterium]|nr:protease modulator HflC [Clostridia bacterium]